MDKETALSAEILFDVGDSEEQGKSIEGKELFDVEAEFHCSPVRKLDQHTSAFVGY